MVLLFESDWKQLHACVKLTNMDWNASLILSVYDDALV